MIVADPQRYLLRHFHQRFGNAYAVFLIPEPLVAFPHDLLSQEPAFQMIRCSFFLESLFCQPRYFLRV